MTWRPMKQTRIGPLQRGQRAGTWDCHKAREPQDARGMVVKKISIPPIRLTRMGAPAKISMPPRAQSTVKSSAPASAPRIKNDELAKAWRIGVRPVLAFQLMATNARPAIERKSEVFHCSRKELSRPR